jgi:PKD repeat protein
MKLTKVLLFALALLSGRFLQAQSIEISGCPGPEPGTFAAGAPITFRWAEAAADALTAVSVPRCAGLTFTAQGVTGRPPLALSWSLSDGTTATTNPATLTTANLLPGSHLATFRASNAFGTVTRQVSFIVERLGFAVAPTYSNLGDNTVAFAANTLGATEWQWDWGDGTGTAWLAGCAGSRPQKHYAASGVYTVRVRARNCRDPLIETSFSVHATPDLQPRVTRFEAQACPLGFCIFPVGLPILFAQTFNGNPSSYRYDWNGDGTVDQVSPQPVLSHVYPAAGFYQPTVSIVGGPFTHSLTHERPIFVQLDDTQTRPSSPAGLAATLVGYQIATAQTTPGVPPPPPVVVPLYQLTWTDTSSTETGFALYQSQAGGPYVVIGAYGPNTSASPNLPVEGPRSYRVTAFNSGGESLPSATVSVVP